MTRSAKIFLSLLLTISLIGFKGGVLTPVASASISHATHFVSDKGPRLPQDESGCLVCHAAAQLQCQGQPLFADMNFLAVTNVCDPCHSAGGAFDGVAMAKANWDAGVYEADGETLKPGKEQWCATCHDDEPAFSRAETIEPIVIDNPGAAFVGSWPYTTYEAGYYGNNFQVNEVGIGEDTATWRPNIPQADD